VRHGLLMRAGYTVFAVTDLSCGKFIAVMLQSYYRMWQFCEKAGKPSYVICIWQIFVV